jgi:3-deoxy-D-manno-octulosonic-acid transferase
MYRGLLNVIYLFVLTILSPWILWRGVRKGSFLLAWQQRWFGLVPDLGQAHVIWLHAVSVGEVNLLGTVVRELKKRHPDHKIAISSTTATGLALAKSMFPQETVIRFPLDLSWAVNRVFDRWNLSQMILSELELWPNLIATANRKHVPVCVINGRLSESSFRGYIRLKKLVRPMFRSLSFVGAQDKSYAERFIRMGVPERNVIVTGNIKFDNCLLDPFTPSSQNMRRLLGINAIGTHGTKDFRQIDCKSLQPTPIWVAGSTQEGEETIVLDTFGKLRDRHPALRLILVPRHPERCEGVCTLIKDRCLNVVRLSELKSGQSIDDWNLLLVDTVGDLKWIWSLADIAFVGGSFGDRGGQNMIEPAAYGAAVAVGPNTRNFAEVVSILRGAQCLTQLESPSELVDWAFRYLDDSKLRETQAIAAQAIISRQRGALGRTLDEIDKMLVTDAPSRPSQAA